MAYTQIDDPSAFFKCQLYTGNDADSRAVTFDDTDTDMQPDFVWLKDRHTSGSGTSYHHQTFDAARGASAGALYTSLDNGEDSSYPLSSFNSDGFTLMSSTHDSQNENGEGYVAWCWKANGSGSANTTGSVNTTKTSANTTSGFSIVLYDPSGSDPSTLGHGLGAVPKVILTKVTDQSGDAWKCYFSAVGNDKVMQLNLSDAEASSDAWNATTPTSTVFSLGNDGATNGSGRTVVAYCFAEKQGYSKFGSYEGNGNANGPFIYTGFRPALILSKNIDATQNWCISDNKRLGYNENKFLTPNTLGAEYTDTKLDILSNGFKLRSTNAANNTDTNIYMAFAEAPFVNSKGVPCNAR